MYMKKYLKHAVVLLGVSFLLPLATLAQNVAPTISALSVTPSSTSTTVTWITNEPTNSQVAYGMSAAYTTYTTPDSTEETQHSFTIGGLMPSTTYHFEALSIDAGGNLASSSDMMFTTTAAVASTPTTPVSTATIPVSYTYTGTSTKNNVTGVVTPVSSVLPTTLPSTSLTTPVAVAPTPAVLGASISLPPEVVQIDQNGDALVRGTVVSTGAHTITINSWGGTWTVTLGSGAEIIPAAADMSGIQTGDFVGVMGSMGSASMTISNASIVHDWTQG